MKQHKKCVLFGKGHFAEIAYHYLTHDSDYEIVAFTVDKDYCDEESFKGLPLLPFETIETHYSPSQFSFFAPLSYKQMNKNRQQKYMDAKEKGYQFINYISSKAICNAKTIGENCFIQELNNLQPETVIGNNVIMWAGNHIGHHTIIKDNCYIASHVVIGGVATIGENCFIGINATIRDTITVGKEVVVGAGTIILKDIPDYAVIASKSDEISKVPSHRLKNI